MSLCSELKNINISATYFCFIKDMFVKYIQYLTNYKMYTKEYLKKLELLQEKFSLKLTGKEKDIKYKKINMNHIYTLTEPISKIIEKQIETWKICLDGIENQIENDNELIKEKVILFNKFQLMFEEIRKDLFNKYNQIDKLREIYQTNMANTEDIIYKYFSQKDNDLVIKDQMNIMILNTKKIEKEYKDLINSTKLYEETFDSLYECSLENFKKLSSQTSNLLKNSVINFIILLLNNFKMLSSEINAYLPKLNELNETKIIEDIIIKSYNKNNKLIHVKPEKYKLKVFQNKNKVKENTNDNYLFSNPILKLEDGFEEMLFIKDINLIKTIKKMKAHFELFEINNFNVQIEEEKLKCLELTQKIFNIEKKELLSNAPTDEEIEYLNNILNKHHNRVIFLQQLDEFRTSGNFKISKLTFDILSKLLNTIVKTVQKDNDFHAIKNTLILSQTYYKIGKNEDDKIYLEKIIKNNEIFKSKTFWGDFLDFLINKQIMQSVNIDLKNGNILKGDRKEAENNMGNTAFGQILSHVSNMKEFGIDKEIIKQVIFPRLESYKVQAESSEFIKGIINK